MSPKLSALAVTGKDIMLPIVPRKQKTSDDLGNLYVNNWN